MDVKELVAELRTLVEDARSMPMSASAVVNRAEILDLVTRLELALSQAFAGQHEVVAERDAVLAAAHEDARRVAAEAERERDRLVGETEVHLSARAEAERERAVARTEAAELRKETDEYVDTRLATFEITLTKTLEAVARGRSRLHGRSHFDALGESADGSTDANDAAMGTPHELQPREPG